MKPLLILAALASVTPASAAENAGVEFEEDHSLPIVYLSIVVEAGGAQDPAAKLGLANVANQMLLRGTQKHSKNDFNELLNRLGGQLEVETRNEGTVFRGAVLSENLAPFLALVEEAFTKPKFTSEELTKLKKEVESIILERKGNDKSLVQHHFQRFLYGSHPYGYPVIGTRKGVAATTSSDIVDYYAQNFSGKTMRLFGTGAAKADRIAAWFTALGDRLTAVHPHAAPPPAIERPRLPPGRRVLLVDKPSATQAQVLAGGAGLRPEEEGFYAILLANHSFGGGSFQARMMQEIRVKRGWTYGAYNSFRFGREPRHYQMYVFPKTGDTVPAVDLMLKMLEDFAKSGITPDEFQFARESLVNNAPFNYDTSKKRLENATSEYLMRFPGGYYRDFAGKIGKVGAADVLPAVSGFFRPADIALTVVGDAKKLRDALAKLPGFPVPVVKSYLED